VHTNAEKVWVFTTNVILINTNRRSPDRERCLLLCGLRFDRETNTAYDNAYLEKLEKEGAYAKAAAFAVFNLCLRQAIDILNRGASKKQTAILNMVAMALSGFSEESTTLWRESCQKSKSQLSDPYLRATFGFLTADNDSYESVLVSMHKYANICESRFNEIDVRRLISSNYRMKMAWLSKIE